MVEGSRSPNGIYFHTEFVTFKECYLLAALFQYQFGIISIIQKHEGKPMIKVSSKSIILFRNIVRPYFHSSMLYKLEP